MLTVRSRIYCRFLPLKFQQTAGRKPGPFSYFFVLFPIIHRITLVYSIRLLFSIHGTSTQGPAGSFFNYKYYAAFIKLTRNPPPLRCASHLTMGALQI